jgi:hypothetical protein
MWIVPFRVLKHLTRAKRWHYPIHAGRLLQRAKDQFVSEELIQYDPAYAQVQDGPEPYARQAVPTTREYNGHSPPSSWDILQRLICAPLWITIHRYGQ